MYIYLYIFHEKEIQKGAMYHLILYGLFIHLLALWEQLGFFSLLILHIESCKYWYILKQLWPHAICCMLLEHLALSMAYLNQEQQIIRKWASWISWFFLLRCINLSSFSGCSWPILSCITIYHRLTNPVGRWEQSPAHDC